MSARKNVQAGFQPVSLNTNFFIYVIYNKHLNLTYFALQDSDVYITYEDQQKINKFARQNAKMDDLKEESKIKQVLMNLMLFCATYNLIWICIILHTYIDTYFTE